MASSAVHGRGREVYDQSLTVVNNQNLLGNQAKPGRNGHYRLTVGLGFFTF